MARPTSFTKELGEAVCDALCEGVSLTRFCKSPKAPSRATVYRWLRADEAFHAAFQVAREIQAHAINDVAVGYALAEIKIGDPKKASVRLDAAKWSSAQLAPKVYGAKAQLTGEAGGPIQVLVKRFAFSDEADA